jgi:hypothetical protein
MRKKTFLIPAAMIVVALIIGWPLPSRTAQLCPTSPTLTEDGLVSMGNFGAVPYTPTLDTTPLFNCALQFAHSHNLRAIYFPKGDYYFNTPPQSIDFQITIMGDGKGRTGLHRSYEASSPREGLFTFVGLSGSSSVRDLGIVADTSAGNGLGSRTFHGSAISLIAFPDCKPNQPNQPPCGSPDFSLFSNLYLSAENDSSWDVTVYIDGTARTGVATPGGPPCITPCGVRDIDFQNCNVFGGATGAMWLDGVVAFNFIGGGIFQAGGTSGIVLISPSYNGTAGLQSYYVNIATSHVSGILMQASEFGQFSGYSDSPITTSKFSSGNIVIGHVHGGVSAGVDGMWVNSTYIDPCQGNAC